MNANEVRLLIAESLAGISPQHTGKVCNKHVWREIADLRQLAEPEKPEPKFEVGQWAEHERYACHGPITRLLNNQTMEIRPVGRSLLTDFASEFKACSPVCTAEQMSILPRDKVRVDEILVGEDGKPLPQNLQCSGREGTVVNVDGRFSLYLDLGYRTGPPCSRKVYRWNLHIIERGPSGPGGKR